MTERKPNSSQENPSPTRVGDTDPTLPPASSSANRPGRKLIDLKSAVASRAAAPVLDIVQRRMFRDWLRGVRPRTLRVLYKSGPAPLRIDDIDDVLAHQARRLESQHDECRAAQRNRRAA